MLKILAEVIAVVGCFLVLPVVLYIWAIALGVQL